MSGKSEVLISQKQDIFSQLNSLQDYSLQPDLGKEDVPIIREEIKTLKENFQSLKLDIFKHNAAVKKEDNQIEISDFSSFDKVVRDILRKCSQIEQSNIVSTPTSETISVPLEKFSLFTWDGDISKWSTWFSLFSNTVDNNPNLTPSQKFLYLKKYLRGEPLSICDQVEITGENYAEAISHLKKRYQNERRLGSYYLSQLLHFDSKSSGSDLSKFLTVHRSSVAALRNLSEITDLADFCFFHIAYQNLDFKMQNAFDMSRSQASKVPKFEELLEFVQFATTNQELKFDSKFEFRKEDFKPRFKSNQSKIQNKHSFVGVYEKKHKAAQSRNKICPSCSESHKLYMCEKFKSLSADQRKEFVTQRRRCHNCLGEHHDPCPSSFSCLVCKERHHTLLHKDAASTSSGTVSCAVCPKQQVLLGTIKCEVQNNFKNFFQIRTLLDSGAQTSVVTYRLIKKLGLPLKLCSNSVKGLANNSIPVLGVAELVLRPIGKNNTCLKISATVLKNKDSLCGNLPPVNLPSKVKNRFRHLKLADPDFTDSAKIDLILGADSFSKVLTTGDAKLYKDNETGLIAQGTIFGFVIQGAVSEGCTNEYSEVLVSTFFNENSSLEDNMDKFWKSEEICDPGISNPEDEYCERLFTSTTKRLLDGRFSVKLPFKPGAFPESLKNRSYALASYKSLEKRLNKDEDLLEQYQEQIQSYLDLGQMVPKPFGEASYILPQLVVVRGSALTTRLRICFNASAAADAGPEKVRTSLNDLLLTGPKLQSDLNYILTKFRLREVGLIADVEMMFRRVAVDPEDRKHLHIFFRKEPGADLDELELAVLPFGLRCSPYLAQRVVQELLNSDGYLFPEASQVLRKGLYVDDFVGSFSSVEEAQLMKEQLSQLMSRGGFTLRKWASSHPEVLANTSADNKGKICFDSENRGVKVLGMEWDAIDDSFTYKIVDFIPPITKRNCLSYIARAFDCLGLVSPVVFWMKLFLQKLWTIKVGWDESLPEDLLRKWENFTSEIGCLSKLRIPRCVVKNGGSDIWLAGFSDGSQVGYAACVYLVVRYPSGVIKSHILTAKSKLAPLSTISIPRLELNGALLMAQLVNNTLQALEELKILQIHLFSDSQIVLAWIKTPPFRLKTYVANRVAKIQNLTSGMKWGYVPTSENPSDCATRGLFPSQLLENSLWWAGPGFLQDESQEWSSCPDIPEEELPEMKESTILTVSTQNKENSFFDRTIQKFSNFGKLQRVMAYVLRFINNSKLPKTERRIKALQVTELEQALRKCIILAQLQDFSEDIKLLKNKEQSSRQLAKLNPFLDEYDIIRVGGRLTNSLLSENEKHPILLSKHSHLSKLICDHYHKIMLHSGPRTTRAVIQKRFWIISIHSLIKRVIYRCSTCRKWDAKPVTPQMGNLPSTRVRPSRCFAYTTLDMAGPFIITETRRRKSPRHKIYVCVFVCEATKAVHLEPVTELSTLAFLAAFNRFVSRRSLPYLLRSDNGRNFIGAKRVLKECQTFLENHTEEISSALSARQVRWRLNPAYSPHFGGLHEAAVKSAKRLFYRVVGNSVLTLEEFTTLLVRIEAVLNSRPIGFLPSDPTEGTDYLSPGHFLVGGPLVSVPEEPLDLQGHPYKRWVRIQQMSQLFWKRFHQEYLHYLMSRGKWDRDTENLTVGKLVYVTGEKTSPLSWPIGKIVATYPGSDGKVRVVDVKISDSVLRRSVHKLVLIPIDSEF